jgi:hypothetical protein
MKKIVSFQIPKVKIGLPLLAGGVLFSLAAGEARAQQGDINSSQTSSPIQTVISGDQGCVTGAHNAQQDQQPQRNCHPVGCVVRCN